MSGTPLLHDLVVLELAGVLAGPSVGLFCAELGATVIKIEPPGTGDVTRSWKLPEESPDTDASAYFNSVNWGKKSVVLNLKTDDGRAALQRIAAKADVVISSSRPHSARILGTDADSLREINPQLIVLQVVAYSSDNQRPGYDAILQAESGFMHLNGSSATGPTKMPVALIDLLAGHHLKEGLLLALLHRERTGEGTTMTVSLLQAAVSSLANQAANYLSAGIVPQPLGSEHPSIAPYGTVFQDKNGKPLVLAVGSDEQFKKLCGVLDMDIFAGAPMFATNQKRVRNRGLLTDLLRENIATHNLGELIPTLTQMGIPAAPVNDIEQTFSIPEARQLILQDVHEKHRAVRSFPVQSELTPMHDLRPPPQLGEHTRSILRELAGLEDDAIDRLIDGTP